VSLLLLLLLLLGAAVGVGLLGAAAGDAAVAGCCELVVVPEAPGSAWLTIAESRPTSATAPPTTQRVRFETRRRPTSRSVARNRMATLHGVENGAVQTSGFQTSILRPSSKEQRNG
jgi:hypothetical protein